MVRIILPAHLQSLANLPREVKLAASPPVLTQRTLLDALELEHPSLSGAIRDHVTRQRRPLVRFFACEEDLSHESPDALLPDKVANGTEPFVILAQLPAVERRRNSRF